MGQLIPTTQPLAEEGTQLGEPRSYDLPWLCLLDQLYGLIETDGGVDAMTRTDGPPTWPEHWQPLIRSWATRIGARSVKPVEPGRVLQAPPAPRGGNTARRRSVTAQAPVHRADWPAITAQSASAEGFTADQEREFHAFCMHLHAALSLRASLDASQASLLSLYGVIDALPLGIVLLDELLDVVLLNRQSRELLARTDRLALHARRLCLPSQQAAFDRALHEFVADPAKPQHHLHLNGLDIKLKKVTHVPVRSPAELNDASHEPPSCPQFSVLLLIHERCDPGRLREITSPPPLLGRQMKLRYALTDKELPLAWNLAEGMALKQYAGLTGRSIETVRAQLKSVFRKLGAADQKDIGVILFEALHAVTLQSMGTHLSTVVADRAAASREPMQPLTRR